MQKTYLLGLLTTLFSACLFAQTSPSLAPFKNMSMRAIGPASMSGRVTAIDAIHTNPDVAFLGTASGGVWKTENGGASWKPVFDKQSILNIGAVAIQQSNPQIVWAGTGEGNPRNSINLGEGIYKSLDGGETWQMMGLANTRNIHRIIVDPNDGNTVYVGAIGNPYGIHPERGVYKTTNGGQTWERILYTNDTTGCADLIMDPSNPNKLFANMWQHRRTPYSFKSGGPGSGFYMTMDGGKNWTKLGKKNGLPDGDYGRIGITISRKHPNVVYALIEATKNGLYRSQDGGRNWELVNNKANDVTNRPFYFQDVVVDPENENRLYSINQMIHLSEDGGRNFKTIIPYSGIHPDHHAFWINPLNANLIYDGNDGGIGISRDRGQTWVFNELLPLGQFYHINVDNQVPYNVMGGLQDNGSWHGPAYTWTSDGLRNYYWKEVWGGDGFDVSPMPDNPNELYAMSQGGSLGRYNLISGQEQNIRPTAPKPGMRLRFNWNAGFAQDPFDASTIYYGSQYLHKSTNRGLNWTAISDDLTTNDSTQQRQDENGGLSIDITGAENYNTIICIEPSPLTKDLIWVGTDDGNVQLTRDGGKTWINFRGRIPGMPVGAWIPQIRASRHNAGEAFVVANDYRRADMKPYFFRTTDYGKTWTRFADESQVKGYALCFLQDPTEPNLMFAGTEQGLWVSLDGGKRFEQWTHNYPSVSTYDMVMQEREADLVIGTFGRAIYILDDVRPLRAAAKATGYSKKLTTLPTADAYYYQTRTPSGYSYSTWGLFNGQNRPSGAPISFFIQPDSAKALAVSNTKGKASEKNETPAPAVDEERWNKIKPDSATIRIYDASNALIRTRKVKVNPGYNRTYWNYEVTGYRSPGSAKPKAGDPEPAYGNFRAMDGTYKVVVEWNKQLDSTMLTVKLDPQMRVDKSIIAAQKQMLKRVQVQNDRLVALTDELTDADEAIAKVEAILKQVEGKEADSLRKQAKVMSDSVKALRHYILGKPMDKQGYGRPYQVTASGAVGQVRSELFNRSKMPDVVEEDLLKYATGLVDDAERRVARFRTEEWKRFQEQVKNTPVSIFK